jgi:hypothetical protein
MDLAAACRPELRHGVAQAQQDEVTAQRGVDAEVVILHFQRQQVAPQGGRNAAEEIGQGGAP